MSPTPSVPLVDSYGGNAPDVRRTDPVTSHAARDSISVEALAESQQEVLAILHLHGMLADHEIVELHDLRFQFGSTPFLLSGSRLRTARKELVDAGLVVASGFDHLTATGRRTQAWAALTAEGREAIA